MTRFLATLLLSLGCAASAASQPAEHQIAAALQAAPENLRAEAAVLGWSEGRLVPLREGAGQTICEADDPSLEGYASSCYHTSMDAYIQRGRELRAAGHSFGEIRDIRGEEVAAGSLSYPDQPVASYFLYGENGAFNPETGEVENVFRRYVLYTPYATVESSGLAETPVVPGAPWLMDAGSYHAHVMITPPSSAQDD